MRCSTAKLFTIEFVLAGELGVFAFFGFEIADTLAGAVDAGLGEVLGSRRSIGTGRARELWTSLVPGLITTKSALELGKNGVLRKCVGLVYSCVQVCELVYPQQ